MVSIASLEHQANSQTEFARSLESGRAVIDRADPGPERTSRLALFRRCGTATRRADRNRIGSVHEVAEFVAREELAYRELVSRDCAVAVELLLPVGYSGLVQHIGIELTPANALSLRFLRFPSVDSSS